MRRLAGMIGPPLLVRQAHSRRRITCDGPGGTSGTQCESPLVRTPAAFTAFQLPRIRCSLIPSSAYDVLLAVPAEQRLVEAQITPSQRLPPPLR